MGLQVPKDIFEQVKSDYEVLRKRGSESLWRRLHKDYPNMPPDDKGEVHRLISSSHSNPAGKSALKGLDYTIGSYLQNSYLPLRYLNGNEPMDKEAMSNVRERVEKTLTSWRGGN